MITERDLEMQYQSDTGNVATIDGKVTSGYSRGFYDWCVDKLLLELNKNFENEINRKHQNFILD